MATNPESGVTQYGYDGDGNVVHRTDANGIITSYSYDGYNRLLGKVYSDGVTSLACFEYDQNTTTNGLGRMTTEWTQTAGLSCPSTPPSSGITTERTIAAYDAMGRPMTDEQCAPPLNCNANSFYTLNYGYDLTGNVAQFTNGLTGSSALSYWAQYDSVDRLCWVGTQQPSQLCGSGGIYAVQSFNPGGGFVNATMGPGISRHRDYSSTRMWPVDEVDTGGTTPGTATVPIVGAEQLSAFSSGSITFNGTEQAPITVDGSTVYDSGNIVVDIGGVVKPDSVRPELYPSDPGDQSRGCLDLRPWLWARAWNGRRERLHRRPDQLCFRNEYELYAQRL